VSIFAMQSGHILSANVSLLVLHRNSWCFVQRGDHSTLRDGHAGQDARRSAVCYQVIYCWFAMDCVHLLMFNCMHKLLKNWLICWQFL